MERACPRGELVSWKARARIYAFWWSGFVLTFYSVYPLTYWLASRRTRVYRLFWDGELSVPLVQEWFWAYVSLYLLMFLPPFFLNPAELRRLAQKAIAATLIAGICFVAFPAPVGHTRVLPPEEPYHTLFRLIFQIDGPLNSVPSLHVCYAAMILLALGGQSSTFLRAAWIIWMILIACSTVLVHQHHVLDIVLGLALALLLHYCFRRAGLAGAHPQSE